MTAAELIRRLQQLPPDAEVNITCDVDADGATLYSWVTGTFDQSIDIWYTREDE